MDLNHLDTLRQQLEPPYRGPPQPQSLEWGPDTYRCPFHTTELE